MTTVTADKKRSRRVEEEEEEEEEEQPLIPGLPDHLAQDCLSRLSPSLLYCVCRSWRRLIYSPSFPPFLYLYALLSSKHSSSSIQFSCFDPLSSTWHSLPSPPSLLPPLLLRHPSFLSRALPVQSAAAAGHLVLLAATTHHLLPALSRPLVFNPLTSHWRLGPPISPPRRWCAAGSFHNSLYIASGVGSGYDPAVARSAQKLELLQSNRGWEEVGRMKDGRFSREAVEAVGWRGKLCMVNVKGSGAKEGVEYDVGRDTWREMRGGMLEGWRGPACGMGEEEMYVVDERRGLLGRYDEGRDCWESVGVEAPEVLKGAVHVAAGGGKVCVVVGEGNKVVVVDVVERPGRVWVVDPPEGMQVLAVHVLPRMTQTSS